jgi:hypothetical protein
MELSAQQRRNFFLLLLFEDAKWNSFPKLNDFNTNKYWTLYTVQKNYVMLRSSFKKVFKSIISPVVLYGCETWSLTLREEHKLRVFEKRVLSRIFGSKRDEVTGDWRKVHNAELDNLYASPSIIRVIKSRRMRWPGYVA